VEKALAAEGKSGDWEIDRRSLKIGEKIASGSCGDLYVGLFCHYFFYILIFLSILLYIIIRIFLCI